MFALRAQTTPVVFPVNTLFGGAAYNQPLTITAANTLITDGQNLWAGTYTIVPASITNPVVNLYPNTYLLTVGGVVKPARFTVPPSTNLLDVTQLLTSGPLFYFGTNGFANLLAGTNVALVTNSDGSITLNVGGGLRLLTNAVASTSPGISISGQTLLISTNYDGLGSAQTLFAAALTNFAIGVNLAGTFTGNGAGLTNLPHAKTLFGTLPLTATPSANLDGSTNWTLAVNETGTGPVLGGSGAVATNFTIMLPNGNPAAGFTILGASGATVLTVASNGTVYFGTNQTTFIKPDSTLVSAGFTGSGFGLTNLPATALALPFIGALNVASNLSLTLATNSGVITATLGGTNWPVPNTNLTTLYPASAMTNFILSVGVTNYFWLLATNSVYFQYPTNTIAGGTFAVWVQQDAIGSRSVSFNPNYFKFSGGIAPVATTNAGAFDLFSLQTLPAGTNAAVVLSPNFK